VRHKANDDVFCAIASEWLITIPHCLDWYKLVLRARLTTLAVQYLVHTYNDCITYWLAYYVTVCTDTLSALLERQSFVVNVDICQIARM